MMRKFNKKKGSRQGAILVTVVFILAFAIIFIAAAMVLTQNTRKRIYTEAESSQARLTVTSVAEAFYRAIEKCEFQDADIISLCTANTPIRVYASTKAGTIPGLENYNTTSTESYTTVQFSRSHKGAGYGTTDDDYFYYADFSTHIEGQVENVRAKLRYKKPTDSKTGAPFGTQVDLNGEFGNNNLNSVGDGKENDPDNIFLVRKGGMNTDGGFSSHATLIYCDGAVAFKDDDHLSTDVVFLTGAYLKANDDSTNPKGNLKNLFFYGDSNNKTDIADNGTSGWSRNFHGELDLNGTKRKLNFFLCNRTDNWKTWTEKANVYEIDEDGNITKTIQGSDPTADLKTDDFKTRASKYAAYNNSYKKGGTNTFPTTEDFLASARKKLDIDETHPSTATKISLGDFLETYNYYSSKNYLPSGEYYFNTDGSSTASNDRPGIKDNAAKNTYVIVLESGKNYRFWFGAGETFKLFNVIFVMNNPDKSKPVLFLLEDGAKVYWPGGGNASGGNFCGNGILAVEGRTTYDTAEKAYNFVINNQNKNAKTFENDSTKYSKHYDGKNEPCAMVIGMNNNLFQTDKHLILEAFVGLFNFKPKTEKDKPTTSRMSFRNADDSVIYGRLMTDQLGFGAGEQKDSSSITMPASPGASTLPNPNPKIKKVVTGFKLESMVYYYGLGK